jgi:hypothetical protein
VVFPVEGSESLPPLPTYRCPYVDRSIVNESATDEYAWSMAPAACLVNVIDGNGTEGRTEFRALWSEEYLHLLAKCEDSDVWGTLSDRDDPLHEEDVVELFINPSGDGESYYEIEVGPLGTILDLFVLFGGDFGTSKFLEQWDSEGIRTTVGVDGEVGRGSAGDGGWTVSLAIPLVDMITASNLPPKPGDRWRWNVYRIDRGSGGTEYQAWSPTGAVNFHVPERFGILEFVR